MTPEQYRDKELPGHLDEVVWYQVHFLEHVPWICGVVQYRAVFYLELVRWEDHPWGEDRSGGADFENHWTLEKREDNSWRSSGRTADGWRALWSEEWYRRAHPTPEGALRELLKRLQNAAEHHEKRAAELRDRIVELCAAAKDAGHPEFEDEMRSPGPVQPESRTGGKAPLAEEVPDAHEEG